MGPLTQIVTAVMYGLMAISFAWGVSCLLIAGMEAMLDDRDPMKKIVKGVALVAFTFAVYGLVQWVQGIAG